MSIRRLELEMYYDGELDGWASARLAERLWADGGARARLGGVARLDAAIRAGLTAEPAVRPRRPEAGAWLALAGLAAVVLLGAWAWLGGRARESESPAPGPMAAETAGPVVRVIASWEVRGSGGMTLPEAPPAGPDLAVLDEMLSRGDLAGALVYVEGLEGAERSKALVRIGRARLAADTSRRLLDAMTPAMQVEACRAWAEEPALRPVAFERLAALREDPRATERARAAAADLAGRADLSAWVRSYLGKCPAS